MWALRFGQVNVLITSPLGYSQQIHINERIHERITNTRNTDMYVSVNNFKVKCWLPWWLLNHIFIVQQTKKVPLPYHLHDTFYIPRVVNLHLCTSQSIKHFDTWNILIIRVSHILLHIDVCKGYFMAIL